MLETRIVNVPIKQIKYADNWYDAVVFYDGIAQFWHDVYVGLDDIIMPKELLAHFVLNGHITTDGGGIDYIHKLSSHSRDYFKELMDEAKKYISEDGD